jgi:hypothetical protein
VNIFLTLDIFIFTVMAAIAPLSLPSSSQYAPPIPVNLDVSRETSENCALRTLCPPRRHLTSISTICRAQRRNRNL